MYGQRIGYVRVSSFDQNPERQLEGVQVARMFTDKASGKDTQRPELERLLAFVRESDTVVVHSMDRLARNLDDLRRIVQGLTKRGVRIEFVKESLAFTGEDSPMANLMLSVMGAFAEFDAHAALGQALHDAAQVIQVACQPIHAVHHHGIAFAYKRKQTYKLGALGVLAGCLVGEHPSHMSPLQLPVWVLVEASDADVADALTVQGVSKG